MTRIFQDKHIILGVTGSIACYKAADLASKLSQAGAIVDVILTQGAEKFVSSLTFQSVTGRKAFTENDLWGGQAHVLHVGLGHTADLLVIAPCTANTIAKLAGGIANNLLTITALAAECPILIAPAMDAGMYSHPATHENVSILAKRGIQFAGPGEGRMASGLIGLGRMLEPEDLFGHIRKVLGKNGSLSGRQVVVTAGGTQEPIDPVRYISNRSSGKQGYSLAQAAIDEGATVTLISTPTALHPPIGAIFIKVQTAQEMLKAVLDNLAGKDALIMAAAVADFKPQISSNKKIKKRDGFPPLMLEPTVDILAALNSKENSAQRPRVLVGFAAESQDLFNNAREKLQSKNLDMIAANDISASDSGFSVDNNKVTLLYPDGNSKELPLQSKAEIAEAIISSIAGMMGDH
ncbi:MAG TPA: bifunctional phosphopantothenoylcysteine decarboxylase/phosphopantothenate--cysteine ligase CoaBC [Anaerolineales bacterium]|nr:bifunctional phosphopantothenoylcysteine decarboxylase/phosphopantothenate--cysteine ligase CoaBC [Anaerolineales bacterium]